MVETEQDTSSRCCGGLSLTSMYTCLKTLLILYNFVFMLFSMMFIALGVYAELLRAEMTEVDHVFLTPSVFLFTIGMLALFFSLLGFVASLRDNIFLLNACFICILVCVLLEITAGILALFFKDEAKNLVNVYLLEGLTTYYDDQDLKNFVDYMQREFNCCGGRYYKDWEQNIYHNCSSPGPAACGVPFSCCIEDESDLVINSMCGYDAMKFEITETVHIIYVTGCIDKVLDYLWNNLSIFAAVLLGVFLPQVSGAILAIAFKDVLIQVIANNDVTRNNEVRREEEMHWMDRDSAPP